MRARFKTLLVSRKSKHMTLQMDRIALLHAFSHECHSKASQTRAHLKGLISRCVGEQKDIQKWKHFVLFQGNLRAGVWVLQTPARRFHWNKTKSFPLFNVFPFNHILFVVLPVSVYPMVYVVWYSNSNSNLRHEN